MLTLCSYLLVEEILNFNNCHIMAALKLLCQSGCIEYR